MFQVWLGFQAGYILQVWRKSRTRTKNIKNMYILTFYIIKNVESSDILASLCLFSCLGVSRLQGSAEPMASLGSSYRYVRAIFTTYFSMPIYVFNFFSELCHPNASHWCYTLFCTVLYILYSLRCPAFFCKFYIVLHCLVSSYIVLHCPTLSFIVLHCPGLSCTVMNYPALFCIVLHCPLL